MYGSLGKVMADFQAPASGIGQLRAQLMYAFFRAVTGLSTSRLTPPDDLLRYHGFALRERRMAEWGLLHTDLGSGSSGPSGLSWHRNGFFADK